MASLQKAWLSLKNALLASPWNSMLKLLESPRRFSLSLFCWGFCWRLKCNQESFSIKKLIEKLNGLSRSLDCRLIRLPNRQCRSLLFLISFRFLSFFLKRSVCQAPCRPSTGHCAVSDYIVCANYRHCMLNEAHRSEITLQIRFWPNELISTEIDTANTVNNRIVLNTYDFPAETVCQSTFAVFAKSLSSKIAKFLGEKPLRNLLEATEIH